MADQDKDYISQPPLLLEWSCDSVLTYEVRCRSDAVSGLCSYRWGACPPLLLFSLHSDWKVGMQAGSWIIRWKHVLRIQNKRMEEARVPNSLRPRFQPWTSNTDCKVWEKQPSYSKVSLLQQPTCPVTILLSPHLRCYSSSPMDPRPLTPHLSIFWRHSQQHQHPTCEVIMSHPCDNDSSRFLVKTLNTWLWRASEP